MKGKITKGKTMKGKASALFLSFCPTLFCHSIGAIALLGIVSATAKAVDVVIVRDGQPAARIVVGQAASQQVKDAASTLVAYLREASGATLDIVADNSLGGDPQGPLIHVGPNRLPLTQDLLPKGIDEDGFVILAQGRDVVILGPSDYGTEFGVYEFLERYVGVRWLLPGAAGTDVPRAPTIAIPEGRQEEQPVFFSRLYSGLQGAAQTRWARFNRMHGRVSFHHNLLHLFPPSRYTASHPEFFPVREKGDRSNLPERPGGCCAQIGPVPFFTRRPPRSAHPVQRVLHPVPAGHEVQLPARHAQDAGALHSRLPFARQADGQGRPLAGGADA
jgi:hypothetical protein